MHATSGFWTFHFSFRKALLGAAISFFVMVSSARGQTSEPKSVDSTAQVHWHKYVNRNYGFSFLYPDTYKPVPMPPLDPAVAKSRQWLKPLLLLQQRDHPDAWSTIEVHVDVRPFHIGPRANRQGEDETPPAQRIGRHVFYYHVEGSMSLGFIDVYEMNLRGKSLTFVFGPGDYWEPREDTKPLESKMLESFRTF